MCVDDYEFKHYSATRIKQCRRFVIYDQDQIQKTYLVNISQFQENGQVALCKILFYLSQKGLAIANRAFYMPKYNISIKPGDYCRVPFQALTDKQIVFKSYIQHSATSDIPAISQEERVHMQMDLQQINSQIKQQQIENTLRINQNQICTVCCSGKETLAQSKAQFCQFDKLQSVDSYSKLQKIEDIHSKRIKQPQRMIGEVIIAVKKWRTLYQGKKLNLTKAAKLIGISKKSLDDYFLVLRVGQILGFDYGSSLNNKMGDLRAYIRTFDYKVSGKLTKQVKCFQLVPQIQVDSIMEGQMTPQEQFQQEK